MGPRVTAFNFHKDSGSAHCGPLSSRIPQLSAETMAQLAGHWQRVVQPRKLSGLPKLTVPKLPSKILNRASD
jgi:hypothetical protein